MVNDFISKLLLIHDGFVKCQEKYSKFISYKVERTEAEDSFQRALKREGHIVEHRVRFDVFRAVEDFFAANPDAVADGLEGKLIDNLRKSYKNYLSIDHEQLCFHEGWNEEPKNMYFSEFYHNMIDELDAIKYNISGVMYLAVAGYVRDKRHESAQ